MQENEDNTTMFRYHFESLPLIMLQLILHKGFEY